MGRLAVRMRCEPGGETMDKLMYVVLIPIVVLVFAMFGHTTPPAISSLDTRTASTSDVTGPTGGANLKRLSNTTTAEEYLH